VIVAIHQIHLPGPYDGLSIAAAITNSAAVTNTNFTIDYMYFANLDRVQIDDDFNGEPIRNQIQGVLSSGLTEAIKSDGNGNLGVSATPVDGVKQTYSAVINNLAVAATPTDIFTITGSNSKTIRVTKIEIDATRTTAGSVDALLIKRSTANTGGTSAAATAVPHDSNNAAASATVLSYTANPTLGTAVGTLRTTKMFIATTTTAGAEHVEWDFGNRPGQAIVLRGTSQVLAINLNSVAVAGSSFDIYVEWTEE
jgi:hypothetical protein